jgi:Domain of unknown function (DUF4395)
MSATSATTERVDPRGVRFGAGATSVVLAAVLLTESGWLLTAQAVVFAIGVIAGPRRSPYSLLFAAVLRPRLGPPGQLEPAGPPRFAQAVGLAFALVGVIGFAVGATLVGLVATGLALVAALLNAVTGFCLGCEMFLLIRRFIPSHTSTHDTEVSV